MCKERGRIVAIGSRAPDRAREFAARHGIAEGCAYDGLLTAEATEQPGA